MKTKKNIDDMIAQSMRKKRDAEIEGRLKGLQWGRDRSKEEIQEKIDELTKQCPAGKWELGNREIKGHIRALQWIIRSYKDERKGKRNQERYMSKTGTTVLRETYTRPRR